eukprot:5974675-Lingulodinium_polyedra.AAC.1
MLGQRLREWRMVVQRSVLLGVLSPWAMAGCGAIWSALLPGELRLRFLGGPAGPAGPEGPGLQIFARR